ncbi:glutamate--cysteine ligase [Streptomyces diacarni]|uniref:Glutamate--cysteine ligase n=1 Tax=Streptomyces diacarni TaxID=2800381 RepID=A0A367EY35_9ACTN|nr:glutamate-cysteine ligase family protein [Streptomyces diacarni]RCG23066.1 glutamate--cysteine ligase [Streptomyces diacarni]
MAPSSTPPPLTRAALRSVFAGAAGAVASHADASDPGDSHPGVSDTGASGAGASGAGAGASGPRELVGVEVETAAVDPATGAAVPYEGPRGLRALLELLAAEWPGAAPVSDRAVLTGVRLAGGGTVTLEHGGAVEYSSPPRSCVAELARVTDAALREVAAAARRLGFALVPGGQYPFTAPDQVAWTPHSRTPVMRRHFESLGPAGSGGPWVMSLALSTQVSLDFTSQDDLADKLRTLAAVSTPAAALFLNAPLEDGRPCGLLSRRMDSLRRTDPARTGVIPAMLRQDVDVEKVIDWALTLPMIHRAAPDGGRCAAPAADFSTLLTTGFPDGGLPGLADWRSHLSQVFSDVRVRETLELRAVDGPPYRALFAAPAFFTGLGYHPPARAAALRMLSGISPREHRTALEEIARRGLGARLAGRPVREVAAELLRLSREGLRARVATGAERPEALAFLDPLDDVLDEGVTFAERMLAERARDPAGFPAHHIARHRVP